MGKEESKALAMRLLEAAKGKCAQAVLDGAMTPEEYEALTKEDPNEVIQQRKNAVVKAYNKAVAEAAEKQTTAYTEALDNLVAIGVDEAEAAELLS